MASARERDEGLRRVGRLTRWVTAAAVGAAGVFSIAAAKAVPGRSTTRLPAGQAPSAASTANANPGDGTNGVTANGATATTVPSAADPNAGLTPLAPPPLDLGAGGGRGSVVSGGS